MRLAVLIASLFLVLTIHQVNAVDIDITEFDERMGDALGIGAFGGGLLITMILLIFSFGLIAMISRKQPSNIIVMFLGIAVCSFAIACGWFPVWSLVFIIMGIAFLFGKGILGALHR